MYRKQESIDNAKHESSACMKAPSDSRANQRKKKQNVEKYILWVTTLSVSLSSLV